MLPKIHEGLYLLVPMGIGLLIYLGKIDIHIDLLGGIVKIVSK